jgi:hypothetical protein
MILVFANSDINLENLRRPDETWKVCLIETPSSRPFTPSSMATGAWAAW